MLDDIGKKMEGLPSLDDDIVMLEGKEAKSVFTEPKSSGKGGKSMILLCGGFIVMSLMLYFARRRRLSHIQKAQSYLCYFRV